MGVMRRYDPGDWLHPLRPHVGRLIRYLGHGRSSSTEHTMQARQTIANGVVGQKALLCPKQRTRVSTTRHVQMTSVCSAYAKPASDCSVEGTQMHTLRYQPFRSRWASHGHAVLGSGPCQSSKSLQQVRMSAERDMEYDRTWSILY